MMKCVYCEQDIDNETQFPNEVEDNKIICCDCFYEDYEHCSNCEGVYLQTKLVRFNNDLHCRSCLNDIRREVNELISYLDDRELRELQNKRQLEELNKQGGYA